MRRHHLAMLGVFLLAFGLRLFRLADANIWWDEGLAVWAARAPLPEMARWTAADVHPPLYFAMLHAWRLLAGENEFAVRFLSAVFGVLAVAALYALGRAVAPQKPWVAVGAALLLSLSRFGVWWSQEARMYMLGGLLCTLSLLLTVRLRQRFTWRRGAAYVLVTAAALWTLYLLVFLPLIESLYWLWTLRATRGRERRRFIGVWVGLQLAVFALFAPWIAYALPRMRSWSVATAFEPGLFIRLYATLLVAGRSQEIELMTVPVLLVMVLMAAGVLLLVRRVAVRAEVLLLLLAVLLPPAVVWAVTALPRSFGYVPKPEARYLLPYAPAWYLLAAWSLSALGAALGVVLGRRRQWMAVVLIVLAAGLSAWNLDDYYGERFLEDDYRSVAQTLKAHVREGDLVLLHTDQPWPVFAYHYDQPFKGTPNGQEATAAGADYFLQPLWAVAHSIWLVVNEDGLRADKDRLYEAWLAQRAAARQEWRYGDRRIVAFARTPERGASLLDLAPGFAPPLLAGGLDGGQALVGWEQPLHRLRAGEPAHVAGYIDATSRSSPVTLALGDPALATTSAEVPADAGVARVPLTLVVPVSAEPGRYPWRLETGAGDVTAGWVDVVGSSLPEPAVVAATPGTSLSATFGDPPLARLLGYDVDPAPQPGATMALTLYWQVVNPSATSYKVFTHVIGPDGRVAAQGDAFPLQGERPTTTWRPGEALVDAYSIQLDPALPAGRYVLKVGFYDPVTGARLPVMDASGQEQPDGQMVLGEVEVEALSAD